MDEMTRKLIEQAMREKRRRDELLGPAGSVADIMRKIELSNAAFGGSIADALKKAGLDKGLTGWNRDWAIAAERLGELSAFNAIEHSRLAKIAEAAQFGLDDTTRKALEAAARSLTGRFRFPEMAELRLFHKGISEALAPFGTVQRRIGEVWRSLGSLKTPWLDTLDTPRSMRGLVGLAALGTAAHIAPFDPVTIQTVRSSLGTWTSIPAEAEEDSLKREEFYEQHGLDTNLIAIPEPAFTEALETTGIVSVELLPPDVDRIEFDVEQQELTPEEAALFGRLARAASLLQVFEFKLREYLHRVMTERCGNDWEKARSPENGAAYQRWKEKRERAVRNGEVALDLIYYADFTDYANLITRRDNWREVFSAVFLDQTDVQVSFRRLEPLRVPAMHSRPLNKTDLLTIGTETTRILTAIGVLRRQ